VTIQKEDFLDFKSTYGCVDLNIINLIMGFQTSLGFSDKSYDIYGNIYSITNELIVKRVTSFLING